MAKSDIEFEKKRMTVPQNPFLSEQADLLWDSLKQQGKPVSKETLFKRIKDMKGRGDTHKGSK